MSPVRTCPDCVVPLLPDAPRGLRPHCLMRAALPRPASDGPAADTELTSASHRPTPLPTAARKALACWKQNPNLAGVRDPDALAKLPQPEPDAWRALWADVDRLLR